MKTDFNVPVMLCPQEEGTPGVFPGWRNQCCQQKVGTRKKQHDNRLRRVAELIQQISPSGLEKEELPLGENISVWTPHLCRIKTRPSFPCGDLALALLHPTSA